MGRKHLMAHSDERVAMFNPKGEVVFEQPLEGDGPSVVEMFQIEATLFSCFVRGDIVTVYRESAYAGTFRIESDAAEVPVDFTGNFEPLELIFNQGLEPKLLLTAKVGTDSNGKNMISVFDIDFTELKSEFVSKATVGNFASTSRTKSNVIFHVDEAKAQSFAFNPLS